MTPAQTANDILNTIPAFVPCCNGKQEVSTAAIAALRDAVRNAVEEEELVTRLLARLRPVAAQNVVRMQAEADGSAVMNGGQPNPVSEQWLVNAREILHSLNARLGVNND